MLEYKTPPDDPLISIRGEKSAANSRVGVYAGVSLSTELSRFLYREIAKDARTSSGESNRRFEYFGRRFMGSKGGGGAESHRQTA